MATIQTILNGDSGFDARNKINQNDTNLNNDKLETSLKGAANGLAELDATGKVPTSQLPVSAMEYKGTWDASTNTPTLADGVGNTGDVYNTSVAGTQDLGSGNITFNIGDWVIYNGSIWEKSSNTSEVQSVFSRTGAVTAQTGDYTGSQVTNVPSGGVAATDVQAAINELDLDKENSFTKNTAFNKDFGSIAGTVTEGNDARLSDARTCNNTFLDSATSRFNLGVGAVGDGVFQANSTTAAQQAMGVQIGVNVQAYNANYALTNQSNTWTITQTFNVITSLVYQTGQFVSFTLSSVEAGSTCFCSNVSPMTCTIPLNSTTSLPLGTTVALVQAGPGQLTVNPTGGVTLRSKNNNRKLAAQWSSAALQKIGTDEWLLVGDLVV